mmetsp:Transcript_3336/g.8639  ORF Transcript_3336/g.8639 Transcript_3336/m.8639 type:complete len:241 (-) Transcript_3336:1256-1978(-)
MSLETPSRIQPWRYVHVLRAPNPAIQFPSFAVCRLILHRCSDPLTPDAFPHLTTSLHRIRGKYWNPCLLDALLLSEKNGLHVNRAVNYYLSKLPLYQKPLSRIFDETSLQLKHHPPTSLMTANHLACQVSGLNHLRPEKKPGSSRQRPPILRDPPFLLRELLHPRLLDACPVYLDPGHGPFLCPGNLCFDFPSGSHPTLLRLHHTQNLSHCQHGRPGPCLQYNSPDQHLLDRYIVALRFH